MFWLLDKTSGGMFYEGQAAAGLPHHRTGGGTSTPLSTYRGRQMHHTLRYGKHDLWKVIVYGEITEAEKETFRYLAERNALNDGFERSEVTFIEKLAELENLL